MVEIWVLHTAFMAVFFGLPLAMGLFQYKKWRQNNDDSLLRKIKKDLGMNF
ncbi:hypothetical protein NsoK4_03610 [Nitrosopumilus sp. K4]|uniref:hypothetical protein n=1 Tax=Nitrosopumilus sp. K4 TaxID=2795383 RepID=UPI001BAC2E50|nr:hypothetical protein [Nitrosopumilus sp. K4]QUC65342.1 hypothetical protein NsoK4_03610 [Nitrosopumilus sp. K4]